jgi:hypothetical protein
MMAKKKGGMVLIIGMGAKPKKEKKDSVKKAVRPPRRRGGGDSSNRARTHSFKQKMRGNPNHLDEILERIGVDRNILEAVISKKHNMNLESALQGDVNMPEMIDEARKINSANKGQFDEDGRVKNKKLAEALQRQGIRVKDFQQSFADNPLMEFSDRMGKLRSEGGEQRLQRAPRRRVGQKKKPNMKGDMFDTPGDDPDEEETRRSNTPETPIERERRERAKRLASNSPSQLNYDELYNEMFEGKNERDDARSKSKKDKFTDFVGDEVDESAGSDRHFRMLERLFQANQRDPTEAALRELGQGDVRVRDERKTQGENFPGFTVGGRVQREPSTEFEPQTSRGRLSSPQEENRVATSSDSRNVMDLAWALLKGNPSMRDAEGRAINHPAAMVYDDLAHQVHMNEIGPNDFIDDPDDETAADRMEQMRNPTHQRKVIRRLKQGKHATPLDLRMATHNDKAEEKRLNQYRQEAREQTRNTMEFGNEDESPGPNYGIQQSTGTDVRMKPGNVMDQM